MAFSFSPRFWSVRWTLPAIAAVGLCCENHLVLAQSVKPVGGAKSPGGLGIPPAIRDSTIRDSTIRDSTIRDSTIRDASATQGKRPAASNSRPGVPNPAGANTAPSVAPVRGEIAGSELLRDPHARFLLQLRLGQITPQEAWQNGQIKADDIVEILSKAKRVASGERNEELQRDLAGVLVQNAPQLVQDHRTLPLWVRVALARYYSSIGDVRTVEISEDLLKELDGKPKDADPWPQLWGVIFLAQYYEKTQQWQKAGETWERALGYQSSVGWWQAGVRIDAARAYKKTGTPENQQKAEALYAQVPKFGNGWDTIMSYYDHALPLIDAGKLDEAKAILSQDLQVKENPEVGLIAQNAWLASLAYRQGKLDEALRYGQKVMQLGEKTKLPHEPSRNLYALGRDIYIRAGGWKTQPIQSDVKEVIIKTNPSQPDKPLYARFRIKTYGDTSVIATVDNPAVQVRVLPINNWQSGANLITEGEMELILKLPKISEAMKIKKVNLLLKSSSRVNKEKAATLKINLYVLN